MNEIRTPAMKPITGWVIVTIPEFGPARVVADGAVFGSKEDAMRVANNMIPTSDDPFAIASIGVVATQKNETKL